MENKIYAVKKIEEWWAVIDCGETKKGGMAVGNFWPTHFEKNGRTYRWYRKIESPPNNLEEWNEIKVKEELVCKISESNRDINVLDFNGWDDEENLAYKTLQNFAKMIGKDMSIEEIREIVLSNKK